MGDPASTRWPKTFPPLSDEQRRISDDFMKHWHEVLPARYGIAERFNHGYSVKNAPKYFERTLEIGAGLGEHLSYERLTKQQRNGYHALELRSNMAEVIRQKYPDIVTVVGDCQTTLPFPNGYFDRILAIHVLEHLPNLPAAVTEMYRLCATDHGTLSVVIPCEGGLMYGLARKVSAKRIFEKRYGQSYDWFISREHINRPAEIMYELSRYFSITNRCYFPLFIPTIEMNLCVGITLEPNRHVS